MVRGIAGRAGIVGLLATATAVAALGGTLPLAAGVPATEDLSAVIAQSPSPSPPGTVSDGATEAWELGQRGHGVTVAVVDSGIDDTHPDLAGGLWSPLRISRERGPQPISSAMARLWRHSSLEPAKPRLGAM